MSVRRIRWTRRALRRLEAIGDHIARDNPVAAADVVERILASVEPLGEYPALGRPGRIAGTRENVVTGLPYMVPYRVKPNAIEILTILHGAQKWPDKLD